MVKVAARNWQYKAIVARCPWCEQDPPHVQDDPRRREPPPALCLMVHEADGGGWQLFQLRHTSQRWEYSMATLLGPRFDGMPVIPLDASGGVHAARIKAELVGVSWFGQRIPFPPQPDLTFDRREWVRTCEPQINEDRDTWVFRCRLCKRELSLDRELLDDWRPK